MKDCHRCSAYPDELRFIKTSSHHSDLQAADALKLLGSCYEIVMGNKNSPLLQSPTSVPYFKQQGVGYVSVDTVLGGGVASKLEARSTVIIILTRQ